MKFSRWGTPKMASEVRKWEKLPGQYIEPSPICRRGRLPLLEARVFRVSELWIDLARNRHCEEPFDKLRVNSATKQSDEVVARAKPVAISREAE